jgi:o-succinylbenzoate synthase
MTRIDAVELIRVAMPLVRPFRTSFGTQQHVDRLVVRAITSDGEGWGECVAPSEPTYSSEYTAGAQAVIADVLLPRLFAAPADPDAAWADVSGHLMANAAVGCAVLDAHLRAAGRSLADHLGASRDRVPCGVSVGIPDGGTPALIEQAQGYLDDGYLRIKVKIEPGFDAAPLAALRAALGDEVALQVDANAAYTLADLDVFRALDASDLQLVEQPFGARRLRDHAVLARTIDTPVCLDESIEDVADARDAVVLGAAGVVNVKVGRVGGIAEAVRIHDTCRRFGVPVWCGGMLETGIGRAVNVALAALPGFTLPGDTSASDRYWAEDLTEPFVLEDGHLAVPDGPGIGRTPRPELLDAWATSRVTVAR